MPADAFVATLRRHYDAATLTRRSTYGAAAAMRCTACTACSGATPCAYARKAQARGARHDYAPYAMSRVDARVMTRASTIARYAFTRRVRAKILRVCECQRAVRACGCMLIHHVRARYAHCYARGRVIAD